jgi:hypothetical protein
MAGEGGTVDSSVYEITDTGVKLTLDGTTYILEFNDGKSPFKDAEGNTYSSIDDFIIH